jgi:hypothetical protein
MNLFKISYHHVFAGLSGLFLLAITPFPLHAQYTAAPLSCEPKNPESAMQCVCNPKLLPSGKYRIRVINKIMGGIRVGDQSGQEVDATVSNCGREISIPHPAGGTLKLVATKLKDDIPIRFQGFKKGTGGTPDSNWDFAVVTGSVQSTGAKLTIPARAELNGRVVFTMQGSGAPKIVAQAKLTLLNPFDETIDVSLLGGQGTSKVNRKCECAKLKRFRERISIYRNAWQSNSIYQRIRAKGLASSSPGVPYMDLDGVVRNPPGYQDYKAGKVSYKELNRKHGTYKKEVGKYTVNEKQKLAKGRCVKDLFPSGGATTQESTCEIKLDAAGLFAAGVPATGIRSMRMHEKVHRNSCLNYKQTMTADKALYAKNSPERIRAEEIKATGVQLKYIDKWMAKYCKKK